MYKQNQDLIYQIDKKHLPHLPPNLQILEDFRYKLSGILLVVEIMLCKIDLRYQIFVLTSNLLALESQLLHCFSNVVSIIFTSSESAIVQLVYDVASRHGFRAADAVGLSVDQGTLICYYSLNNPVTDARYSGRLSESCSLVA